VAVDDDEGEVPFEPREDVAHRLDEVAVVGVFEQVHDDLGVRLGGERVAASEELLAQLAIVLDDPVQDDRDAARVASCERVRVVLGDAAVGRLTSVAEARRREGAVRAGDVLEHVERPDRAHVVEAVVLEEGDAGGVVAAVLEALETLQEQRLGGAAADVSDDPAHSEPPCLKPRGKAGICPRTGLRKHESPAEWSPLRRGGQPSSRLTSAAIVPQAFWATSRFSASASTRIKGSVPDGRTSTRPFPSHSAFSRATSASTAGVSSFPAT